MPTASLRDLLDEMADTLIAYYAAADVDLQIEPRYVGKPTPPTIDLFPGDTARDTETAAMADISGGYFITARARVATADTEAQQDLLIAFMDDEDDLCLAHALLDDPTLNGLASDIDLNGRITGFLLDPTTGLIAVQWTFLVIPASS